jgi:hypothetical protein
VFTRARHLSLSWVKWIQSTFPNPISPRSILMLSSHLRLDLPSGLLPSGLPTKMFYAPFTSPMRATRPAHLILTLTILGEDFKPCSSSLCSFLLNFGYAKYWDECYNNATTSVLAWDPGILGDKMFSHNASRGFEENHEMPHSWQLVSVPRTEHRKSLRFWLLKTTLQYLWWLIVGLFKDSVSSVEVSTV